jgi:hypothetical protein
VSLKKDQSPTSNLNNLFCPDTPACVNEKDPEKVCDSKYNIIHYKGETLVRLNGNGVFDSVMKPLAEDQWITQSIRFVDGNEVYSEYFSAEPTGEQIVRKANQQDGVVKHPDLKNIRNCVLGSSRYDRLLGWIQRNSKQNQ